MASLEVKEEFVVIDELRNAKSIYVIMIETERHDLGLGLKQCLRSLKDAWGENATGGVYGFITSRKTWRMLKYDGKVFTMTYEFDLIFEGMEQKKEQWIEYNSVLVRCMWVALTRGGREE